MTAPTTIHTTIRDALTAAGLHTQFGPAHDLPDTTGGQAAILWPAPTSRALVRASGGPAAGTETVAIVCVGLTTLDAIAAAAKVNTTLAGLKVGNSILRQTLTTSPTPEPGAYPQRVQMTVEYTIRGA